MKTLLKRALIIGVAGSLLLGGTALAHTFVASTSLTIQASPATIDAGEAVAIYGRLKSSRPVCRDFEILTLYRGSTAVGTTTTNAVGGYSFVRHPTATNSWHVVYAGKVWGAHGHSHTCLGSTSASVTVTVT